MAGQAPELRRTLHGAIQSDTVTRLQETLRTLEYEPGEVDGIYGPRTAGAVRAYQESRSLTPDGVVGRRTWSALSKEDPEGRLGIDELPSQLHGSTSGEDVRWLQERLAELGFDPGTVDSHYGPDTERAVLAFQSSVGLTADGVVGPETWQRLVERSGESPAEASTAPDDAAIFTRLGPSSRDALGYADAMRRLLRSREVHMEHLIFGLYQKPDGPTRRALVAQDIDEATLLRLIEKEVETTFPPQAMEVPKLTSLPPLSSHARGAVTAAWRLAGQDPSAPIRSRHLFAGALTLTECGIISQLLERGVTPLLEVESPPLPRPAFSGFSGDEPSTTDHLNFGPDVEALARLLAAKKVEPPISVGLFGDWGTGKSTFMRQLQAAIRQTTAEAREAEAEFERKERDVRPDFCSNVRQVMFNAWSYVDTNLWAGLITRIFEGLAEPEEDEELEERERQRREREQRELIARLGAAEELQRQAIHRRDAAERRKRLIENDLERLREEQAEKRRELGRVRAATPHAVEPKDLLQAAVRELRRLIPASFAEPVGESVTELKELNEELRYSGTRLAVAWTKALHDPKTRRFIVAAGVGAFVSLVLALWLIARNGPMATLAFVASIGAVATGWVTGLSGAVKKVRTASRRTAALVREAEGEREKELRKQEIVLMRRSASLEAEVHQLADERSRQQVELERATTAVAESKEDLEDIRIGRRLYRFIQERATGAQYEKYMGIVALIRKDFRRLAGLLTDARKARDEGNEPADPDLPPIDRIVLYIDDLDRCPAERVVQVLEAVHLLLAFPLFIVVVGVDSRWLLRSLERHYLVQLAAPDGSRASDPGRTLLQMSDEEAGHWVATPQNYLEKIFQIPFTIPRMDPDGFGRLVSELLVVRRETEPETGASSPEVAKTDGEVASTGGAETPKPTSTDSTPTTDQESIPPVSGVTEATPIAAGRDMNPEGLQVSRQELEFVKELAPLVQTPRAAKRLVNTYRLIRAPLSGVELGRFLGHDGVERYRACLVLLAIVIGFPAVADEVFESLLRSELKTWNDFVETLQRPVADNGAAAEGYGKNGMPGGAQVRAAGPSAAWDALQRCLQELEEAELPTDLETYRDWALPVARYSFQTVRLAAEAPSAVEVMPEAPASSTT